MTAIPSPLARSIRRSVDSRTWPTLPGRALEVVDGRRLDRIDDDQPGSLCPRDLDDPPDVVLGQDVDPLPRRPAQQPEPRRADPDLARRFLAGGVEDRAAAVGAGETGRGLEQERGLADPRLAADQHERARDETAAEDAIELVDPQAEARQVGVGDAGQRFRRGGRRRSADDRPFRARGLAHDGLDERVPAVARAALPFPAQERFPAGLADEAALGPRHPR